MSYQIPRYKVIALKNGISPAIGVPRDITVTHCRSAAEVSYCTIEIYAQNYAGLAYFSTHVFQFSYITLQPLMKSFLESRFQSSLQSQERLFGK